MYMKALIIDINFNIISFRSEKKNFFFRFFTRHFRKHSSLILMSIDSERAHDGLSYDIPLTYVAWTWEAQERFSRFWIYLGIP